MNYCVAPCVGAASREEYDEVIKQVILFLEGKQETVVRELEDRMEKAAEALNFEKAALLRDQIQAIHKVIEGQRIATAVRGEQDVITFAQDKDLACAQVFFIRGGKLIGRESFVLQGTQHEEPNQIMASFVKQFYGSSPYIPPLLLLQYPVEDIAVVKDWLQSKRGGRVDIQVPRRGDKRQLVNTVAENARQSLVQLKIKRLSAPKELEAALAEIERELHLPRLPSRIEGYDISAMTSPIYRGWRRWGVWSSSTTGSQSHLITGVSGLKQSPALMTMPCCRKCSDGDLNALKAMPQSLMSGQFRLTWCLLMEAGGSSMRLYRP
jgi:excinuclease ABC subunit C